MSRYQPQPGDLVRCVTEELDLWRSPDPNEYRYVPWRCGRTVNAAIVLAVHPYEPAVMLLAANGLLGWTRLVHRLRPFGETP